MNASAGRIYLNRFGVLAGKNIVVATNNDSAYVTAAEHLYTADIAMREEGGTPEILGSIRAGLVFQPKQAVGAGEIMERERDFIRRAIAAWSATLERDELEAELVAAGVPAHRVSESRDAFEDPQLEARRHFVSLEYGDLGPVPFENARVRFSATPAEHRPCPSLGHHNAEILSEILGLDDERIAELEIAGAVQQAPSRQATRQRRRPAAG